QLARWSMALSYRPSSPSPSSDPNRPHTIAGFRVRVRGGTAGWPRVGCRIGAVLLAFRRRTSLNTGGWPVQDEARRAEVDNEEVTEEELSDLLALAHRT